MAIGVNWAEIWAPVWKAVWTQVPPVEVPDVVGETQAAGTATLEGDGFVVSVSTAYSDSVAVGLIISQDPTGGSFAQLGSTVEIVVSLGPEPVVEQPSGAGKPKRRKRYLIEIDGQEFLVSSFAEAEALLQKAAALAQQVADQAAARNSKRTRRKKRAVQISKPVIETPNTEIQPLVSQYRADIDKIYESMARDAEIRELLRLKLIEEDEDDAVIALLLH